MEAFVVWIQICVVVYMCNVMHTTFAQFETVTYFFGLLNLQIHGIISKFGLWFQWNYLKFPIFELIGHIVYGIWKSIFSKETKFKYAF